MKDPLNYFLKEGFGDIFSFPIGDGKYDARMRWASNYKEFTPSFYRNEFGTNILMMKGVKYAIDDEFMHKYTIPVKDEQEANDRIAEKSAEWEIICKENANIGT